MPMSDAVRVLYVGRNSKVFEQLRSFFAPDANVSMHGRDGETLRLDFSTVTNQRETLALVRTRPPDVVLVETDGKPNTRGRFVETLRNRLPTAAILSVCKTIPRGEHDFNGHIPLPLKREQTMALLSDVLAAGSDYQLQRGDIVLNIARRTVATPQGCFHMTPKQCELLHMLMLNHGEIVRREDLMRDIWQTDFMDDTRTLDVHIHWLRVHIEPDPSAPVYLVTKRGLGYCLQLPEKPN